jgi:hypothetical protein
VLTPAAASQDLSLAVPVGCARAWQTIHPWSFYSSLVVASVPRHAETEKKTQVKVREIRRHGHQDGSAAMTATSPARDAEFEPVYHHYGPHRAGLPP